MPVREITASNFGIKSSFASEKNPTPSQAESMLEHDLLTLLEWDSRVEKYVTQPFTVNWMDAAGVFRTYTPDVLVAYHSLARGHDKNLMPTVFEVKPLANLRRDWIILKPKYQAAIAALRPIGIRFKIVTERHIQTTLLENARFLLAYKTMRYINASPREHEMQIEIRQALLRMKTTTPKNLLDELSDSDEKKILYIPWIWWLMNAGLIRADLTKRLTMASSIWTIDTEKSIPIR
ncbi:Tn7 transposase TnsA N-terminal domain-containing protein [Undibacterium sp. Rencai35W]